jgi:arylformamidase
MKIKRIIDISRNLYPKMNTWTGDSNFKISKVFSISNGDCANLSTLELSAHTGTHIDAPLHFINEGLDISSLDLTRFFCTVKVFELKVETCITEKDLSALDIEEGDSLIFKTSNSELSEEEPISDKYIYLDITAARYLVTKKIRTLGVDHLSIDATASQDYPVHKLLLSEEVGIIEGLRLRNVSEGTYLLAALPLKLKSLDGSPARAVLVEFEEK